MKKIKKTKPTIKGLQRTITTLNQELADREKDVREFEENGYTLRKQITEILLNGNGYSISYRPGSNEVKSWSDIKTSIARLTGMVTKEGEMNSRINHMMDAENARLWYLMRVVVRDPLIQVPVRPDIQRDIFGNEPPRENR
jgi:hypothetical protein